MEIPKRPRENDIETIRKVAAKIATEVCDWVQDNATVSEIKEDITNVLIGTANWNWDGYKLAKRLDDERGYDSDSQLVDILDGISTLATRINSEAVRNWVIWGGIKPKFELCDKIKTSRHGDRVISKIDFPEARYFATSRYDEITYIYTFEEIEKLNL